MFSMVGRLKFEAHVAKRYTNVFFTCAHVSSPTLRDARHVHSFRGRHAKTHLGIIVLGCLWSLPPHARATHRPFLRLHDTGLMKPSLQVRLSGAELTPMYLMGASLLDLICGVRSRGNLRCSSLAQLGSRCSS